MESNEIVVLKYLKKLGVTEELAPFSVQGVMNDMVLYHKRARIVHDFVPKKVKTLKTKMLWMKKLRELGYIEVDYTDKWRPKVKITEKGKQALNQ